VVAAGGAPAGVAGSVSQECTEQRGDGRHLDDDGGEDERVSQEVIDEERQRVDLVLERGEAAEESPAVAPEMPPRVADQIDDLTGDDVRSDVSDSTGARSFNPFLGFSDSVTLLCYIARAPPFFVSIPSSGFLIL